MAGLEKSYELAAKKSNFAIDRPKLDDSTYEPKELTAENTKCELIYPFVISVTIVGEKKE